MDKFLRPHLGDSLVPLLCLMSWRLAGCRAQESGRAVPADRRRTRAPAPAVALAEPRPPLRSPARRAGRGALGRSAAAPLPGWPPTRRSPRRVCGLRGCGAAVRSLAGGRLAPAASGVAAPLPRVRGSDTAARGWGRGIGRGGGRVRVGEEPLDSVRPWLRPGWPPMGHVWAVG
jgi:hypothetical protein